ncbi:MAG: hypothetical protein CVU90_06925 [Firmicutes bacterium HGW-Firmicutes-15]|nr:MAG: hypothetical protein CVU90_06925 [Firmicutes bacterium HGW-Firmicutes-15]
MQVKEIFNIYIDTDIELNISNYLDYFYYASQDERQTSINEEPHNNKDISCENYAYVAAMVEKLCTDFSLQYPQWIFKDNYFLSDPWFPARIKGRARIYLMLYSPIEFLRRNLYVSENVLARV